MTVLQLPTAKDIPAGHVTGSDLCAAADISYRQLDHWTRLGYLHPIEATPGSGYVRAYPSSELATAQLVRRLLDAGMKPREAFTLARDLLEHGHALLAGIRIDLPTEP